MIIGGVPEHFNLPWHLLSESDALADSGIAFEWQDFPGGSGAMVRALNEGRLDAAVLLTEGAAAGLAAGGDFEVLCLYTETPLIWGVHVPAASRFSEVEELREARFAISRYGSGSHLMSFALADSLDWPTERLEFVVVGTLAGAIESFRNAESDVFLWEKFMTQPVVDAGDFRRIGEFAAPWPAFVVAATHAAIAAKGEGIDRVLAGVYETAAGLTRSEDAARSIAARYGLEESAVADWLRVTRWETASGRAEACDRADRAIKAAALMLTKTGAVRR